MSEHGPEYDTGPERAGISEEYRDKIRNLRDNSWFFAFVGVAALPLVWGLISTLAENPRLLLPTAGLPVVYLLIRQAIVWIGERQIKTRYATRMMIE